MYNGDDESVNAEYTLGWFRKQPNEKNRCLYYTNETSPPKGDNLISKTCVYPEQRILDFSHTCITVSPDNRYLGQRGDFVDFQHYPKGQPPKHTEVYQGSIQPRNLVKHVIQRLTYNPDFHGMMAEVDEFIG